jgi:hypothetical protein
VVTRDPDCDDIRIFASVKNNLADDPKSLAFKLVGAANGAVTVEWLGEDRRPASELLIGRRNNLGEMSHRVLDYVNTRSTTGSSDVAQKFGTTRKVASQYLNRLQAGGHIRLITRGVYGPLNSATEGTEDGEDTEDSEDLTGQCLAADLHLQSSLDLGSGVGQGNLQNPHDPQLSGVSKDPGVSTCPECDALLRPTGKCVPCIVKRARATVRSSASQDGAHQLLASGGWAIPESQIGAGPSSGGGNLTQLARPGSRSEKA